MPQFKIILNRRIFTLLRLLYPTKQFQHLPPPLLKLTPHQILLLPLLLLKLTQILKILLLNLINLQIQPINLLNQRIMLRIRHINSPDYISRLQPNSLLFISHRKPINSRRRLHFLQSHLLLNRLRIPQKLFLLLGILQGLRFQIFILLRYL